MQEEAETFKPSVPQGEQQSTYEETDLEIEPLTDATDVKEIVKKDLVEIAPLGRAFVLYNVLSPSECRYYIEQANTLGLLPCGYRVDYRNNDRVVAKGEEVSKLIWDRIKGFMEDVTIDSDNTMAKNQIGSGACREGNWKPKGLNEVWRLCRYQPGGHFAPHFDGYFVRNTFERSMKTFMLYLNGGEDFEGGTTNWVSDSQRLYKDESGIYRAQEENILLRLKPEPGMALVFNHMILHEGEQVKSGLKYIMRSDVLYSLDRTGADTNEQQEEAIRLYQMAERLESDGRAMEAMQCYKKAIRLWPELERGM